MRHGLGYRKLNKNSAARKALLRGLATELIRHGSVATTLERAKDLRKVVEPLVTLAKNDSVFNRRRAAAVIYGKPVLAKLFTEVGPLVMTRNGGYTRILRLAFRPGDNARRAVIELVDKKGSEVATAAV